MADEADDMAEDVQQDGFDDVRREIVTQTQVNILEIQGIETVEDRSSLDRRTLWITFLPLPTISQIWLKAMLQ